MATVQEMKDASRKGSWDKNLPMTIHELNTGSLLRVADATELMATNFIQLQKDRDWWKERADERQKRMEVLYKQISSLKGQVTKLKNKMKS